MTEAAHDESGLDDLDPSALLDALADADRKVREGERDKLRIAHQWAVIHPATEDTGVATWGGDILLLPALLTDESLGGEGCPKVAAYAPEPLAITLGVAPTTAMQLIADALDLRHRLPETWALVESLAVPAWKARRVAQLTHTLSQEAAAWVDETIAPRLTRCGARLLDTVVAEAIARYDPDRHAEREARARKQTWDVTLHTPTASEYAATSELHITGDTLLLTDLYQHLCPDAAAAGKAGDDSPLGVRKVQALATLFSGGRFRDGRCATSSTSGGPLPPPRPHGPRRRPGPRRPGRTARPRHHRQDPRLGRQLPRPHPARHPDGRRRRRRRPRPTRPDARPGHPQRQDLSVPELPGRLTPLRPRPHDPLRPRRTTRPNQTLATWSRSADDTTTPRPAVSGATPARPKATASGRARTSRQPSGCRAADGETSPCPRASVPTTCGEHRGSPGASRWRRGPRPGWRRTRRRGCRRSRR